VTPGSGHSKFNGGVQSVKTMAADVEDLMKTLALDPSRTIVVGHSMGGMVACEVASRVPVRGIVLLGPVNPSPAMVDIFNQRIESVMKSEFRISLLPLLVPQYPQI
jgi:pimeloyl-ACP methyl ester carboxylesterase